MLVSKGHNYDSVCAQFRKDGRNRLILLWILLVQDRLVVRALACIAWGLALKTKFPQNCEINIKECGATAVLYKHRESLHGVLLLEGIIKYWLCTSGRVLNWIWLSEIHKLMDRNPSLRVCNRFDSKIKCLAENRSSESVICSLLVALLRAILFTVNWVMLCVLQASEETSAKFGTVWSINKYNKRNTYNFWTNTNL